MGDMIPLIGRLVLEIKSHHASGLPELRFIRLSRLDSLIQHVPLICELQLPWRQFRQKNRDLSASHSSSNFAVAVGEFVQRVRAGVFIQAFLGLLFTGGVNDRVEFLITCSPHIGYWGRARGAAGPETTGFRIWEAERLQASTRSSCAHCYPRRASSSRPH